MSSQSPGTLTRTVSGQSGLQLGSPGKNSHLDVVSAEWCRKYYMGEGGGFPRVRAVVCVVSKVPVACPHTQGCPGNVNYHFVVCFDADSSLIY
jgi:hypothetical protein